MFTFKYWGTVYTQTHNKELYINTLKHILSFHTIMNKIQRNVHVKINLI